MTTPPDEATHRQDLAQAIWEMPKLPRNTPRIDRLRWIVHHHQAVRMEGHLVDATTANMLVTVHDALNETNRAKFVRLPIRRMVDIGWSVLK